jgi:hypothetical protein
MFNPDYVNTYNTYFPSLDKTKNHTDGLENPVIVRKQVVELEVTKMNHNGLTLSKNNG